MEAFWSLAAYTSADLNMIPNPADRYSIGDHGEPLTRDDDGGLTVHLRPTAPGDAGDRNWLPTSATDPWFLILRLYRPGPPVIDGTWRCPAVNRVTADVLSERVSAEVAR